MPTPRQIIAALTARGKMAVVRSLTCNNPVKHARYRREASGYADLCRIVVDNRAELKK